MVIEEVRMFEEDERTTIAITHAKQCAWTNWNDIGSIYISWKSLVAMEPLLILFLLHSTCDLLLNVTNLKFWGYTQSDLCSLFKHDRVPYAMYYLHAHNHFRCTHDDITRCWK